MKRNKLFNFLALVIGAAAFSIVSACEGPQGPAGADGTPGVDGDEVCLDCHNLTTKNKVLAEYHTSGHAEGGATGYAGGRNGCAMCHSDQGFVETQYTGYDTTAHNISNPQVIQCQTCHSFHSSLDFENEPNYALRAFKPVDLLMYRSVDPTAPPVTLDLGDPGANLCASCHQPRRLGPVDDGTGNAMVTSTHYGPHYGTQSTTNYGEHAYELGSGYPTPGEGGAHVTDATCVSCHMHDGDHSWEPSLDACNTADCHNGNLTSVTDNTRQLAFATLMSTLKSKLTTAGLLDADGKPVVGTYPVDEVGALYNYRWLYSDHSNGTHNFKYSEALLNNSIAVFP